MKSIILYGIILILLPTIFLSSLYVPASAADVELTGEVQLGFLGSMTGEMAIFGENEAAAAKLAVDEVNELLEADGEDWTLKLLVEDTQTRPYLALEKTESFAARGVKLLVGPLSSAELRNIKGYCDANKILAISQSSTAPDIAVADDYIFRFCPTDRLGQGPALARIIYDDGKKCVIPVTRNDAWGVGLEEAAEKRYKALGGTFLDGVRYAPEAEEFTAEAADLASKVESAISSYGAENVCVLHISLKEAVAFFISASGYDVLSKVKWFGSDGTSGSDQMLDDPTVRDFAIGVGYPCTRFAPTNSSKGEKVREHVMKVLGREPDPYSYVAYDIVWVYALSLMEADAYDSEAVKAVLPIITKNYSGASGFIELDGAGDRKTGDYDVWQIFEVSAEEYEWVSVGVWLHLTDSVKESPFMKQLELEDWRQKALGSMDSASQKIDQIRDCESFDAKALLQEARTQLMESQNSFNQATLESYKNALNYSSQAISYANQASLKEVEYQQQRQQTFSVMETAKEKVNQIINVESPDSKQLLQEAKEQLVEAENEYSRNNIEGCKNAYSSALQVISYAEQAYEKEQTYQQAKQQQQRLILIGAISVIAIIIIGTVLMMRKRRMKVK